MEQVDGIAYSVTGGSGTPVVYLHGWLASHESWRPVRSRIETDRPELVYDMRCHGASSCSRFGMDGLVADLHRVVSDAGMAAPVLAGHSLGGMVAMHYALEYEVAGLFLAGTCADTPEPVVHSPKWFLERFGEMDREAWADLILENYYDESTPERIRAGSRQQLLAAGETVIRSGLQTMITHDVRDRLGDISVPCAVIGGRADAAIVPEKIKQLARGVGTNPVFLDAGHDVLHEVPDQVADILSEFLSSSVRVAAGQ